jgi:glycosyltransferase involved in cell wall biosynthesis
MKVSVIIPCYNVANVVGGQLEALAAQRYPESLWVEIICVNNRCTDHSIRIIQQYGSRLPRLRIIEAFTHSSRPYARNAGALAANGDVLLFCDADDEVAPGWLTAMERALDTYDFVACRFDTIKLNPPWLQQSLGMPQSRGLDRLWYPPYFMYAGGSSLGVRRWLHEAVGGFDESMPYLEDTEYCVRIQQYTGQQLQYVPDAVVHIRQRTSLVSLAAQAYHWAEHNEALYSRYRSKDGKDRDRWGAYVMEWKSLLRNLLLCLTYKEGRTTLTWRIGWQLGLLKGCLSYRVPPVS